MSLLIPNYYDQVKNENVIGVITNTFVYAPSGGGRTARVISYIPYNIIFTENLFLGGLLPEPNIDDKGDVNQINERFQVFKEYVSHGEVLNKDLDIRRFNQITIKFEYNKLGSLVLDKFNPLEDPYLHIGEMRSKDTPLINCGRLSISLKGIMALEGSWKFLFDYKLTENVIDLIKKTPLSHNFMQK